jgi:transposase
MKLSLEDKINIYVKRKADEQIPALCQEDGVSKGTIKYWIKLIDIHGYDKLRKGENRVCEKDFKEKAIDRVLKEKETVLSLSLDLGLPSTGVLRSWVSKYN